MAAPNWMDADGELNGTFWQSETKKHTAQHISWVERLYATRLAQYAGGAGMYVLIALFVYVSGWLLAAALNSIEGYTKSPAIWLEVIGIPMVITGVRVLAKATHRMIADVGQIAAGTEEYHSYTAYWKRKMAGIEITVIALLGTVLFTVGIVGAVNIAFDLGEGPFRAGMMHEALLYYSYQMILHGYLILLIGLALSELFKLLFGNIALMRVLFALPVKDDADAVKQHTRSILTMSLIGAFIWTLAAVFFGILLEDAILPGTAVAIGVLMLPPAALVITALLLVARLRQDGRDLLAMSMVLPLLLVVALVSPAFSLPVQQFIQRVTG